MSIFVCSNSTVHLQEDIPEDIPEDEPSDLKHEEDFKKFKIKILI